MNMPPFVSRALLAASVAGGCVACGSSAPSAAEPVSPAVASAPAVAAEPVVASAPLPDGTLPRMFTAEQLRAAMPVGHRLRLRMEAAGAPVIEEQWLVTAADAETCTIASKAYDPDGKLVRDDGAATSTWAELREHGAVPAAATEVSRATVEVPAGRFDTQVYRVTTRDAQGRVTVKVMHFALTLPGPPVLMTVERDGQQLLRMTLLERR